MATQEQELLNLEIKDHVRGVDAIMSKIIKDRSIWKEFFRNPAAVLAEMGFTAPLSKQTEWQYNRIFYALLTDKQLLKFIHEQDFEPRHSAEQVDAFFGRLKDGRVEFDTDLDVEIVGRARADVEGFRTMMSLALNRINEEGIFSRKYDPDEIERSIDLLTANSQDRTSLADMVQNLPWSDDAERDLYKVMAAIPPVAAVPVVVQAVACGTLACVVVPVAEEGVANESVERLQAQAMAGESGSIKALSLLGLLLQFIGELSDHVNDFERIVRA
jgi:hypothetical protein